MPEYFPIIEVQREMRREVEQIGSKPKFWFKFHGENWLFKEARENTGEDWAEKIASEAANLLGLPAHHAELAEYEEKRGCAVKSFLSSSDQVLVHGNELLGGLITGYDKEKHWGQSDHTFDNIVAVLERLFPEGPSRRRAASRMVGYLVLDALVGNTDRHHQNWGVVMESRVDLENKRSFLLQLAPTFDHASSLGRELTDEARQTRLRDNSIESYIRKGRGGIFANAQSKHGMSPISVAEMLAERYPEFFNSWQTRVRELPESDFGLLVERVPEQRMSETARAFALAFLSTSRRLLLNL